MNHSVLKPPKSLAATIAFLTCLTIAHVLSAPSAVGTESLQAARSAHAEGRFTEAAELAVAVGTSEGFALAAGALAIHSYYIAEDDAKPALLERAMRLAQEAVRLDTNNPEAHLQSAHAMGRYAQTIGLLKAFSQGYAGRVREAIQNALRLDPHRAAAHLLLAMWHKDIVASGLAARVTYGATKGRAIANYERALELAADEKVVLVEYAFGLLCLERRGNRRRAHELLTRAIEAPSRDAFERLLHQKAVEQLAALGVP